MQRDGKKVGIQSSKNVPGDENIHTVLEAASEEPVQAGGGSERVGP
jgi:hypothetical protein